MKISKSEILQKICDYLTKNKCRIKTIEKIEPEYQYDVSDEKLNRYYRAITDEIITIKLSPKKYIRKIK
jgi:hypothetical protein